MTPIIFAVLLALALALLALAFWVDDAVFGLASASVFLILAGLLFAENVTFDSGTVSNIELNQSSYVFGNDTFTNSSITETVTPVKAEAFPDIIKTGLVLIFALLGLYIVIKTAVGDDS